MIMNCQWVGLGWLHSNKVQAINNEPVWWCSTACRLRAEGSKGTQIADQDIISQQLQLADASGSLGKIDVSHFSLCQEQCLEDTAWTDSLADLSKTLSASLILTISDSPLCSCAIWILGATNLKIVAYLTCKVSLISPPCISSTINCSQYLNSSSVSPW